MVIPIAPVGVRHVDPRSHLRHLAFSQETGTARRKIDPVAIQTPIKAHPTEPPIISIRAIAQHPRAASGIVRVDLHPQRDAARRVPTRQPRVRRHDGLVVAAEAIGPAPGTVCHPRGAVYGRRPPIPAGIGDDAGFIHVERIVQPQPVGRPAPRIVRGIFKADQTVVERCNNRFQLAEIHRGIVVLIGESLDQIGNGRTCPSRQNRFHFQIGLLGEVLDLALVGRGEVLRGAIGVDHPARAPPCRLGCRQGEGGHDEHQRGNPPPRSMRLAILVHDEARAFPWPYSGAPLV